MRIIRAGEHVHHIGLGISVRESGVAVAGANWWEVPGKTCVAAYQPKGAASYAASKTNLANPGTYDAAEGTAPSWAAATGWTFDGSDDYLNTGINPKGIWSMFIAFNSASPGNICGRRTAPLNNSFYLVPTGGAGERVAQNDGQYVRVSPGAVSSGVFGLAHDEMYLNGISDGEMPSPSPLSGILPIYLGGINNNGSPAYCAVVITAFAIWSDTLTDSEVATVSTAMAAL